MVHRHIVVHRAVVVVVHPEAMAVRPEEADFEGAHQEEVAAFEEAAAAGFAAGVADLEEAGSAEVTGAGFEVVVVEGSAAVVAVLAEEGQDEAEVVANQHQPMSVRILNKIINTKVLPFYY